jgi:membrane protein
MNVRSWLQVLKDTFSSWMEDNAMSEGAALAYYSLFSVSPLLVIAVAIAGKVFGDEAARGKVQEQLQGVMGADSAEAVQDVLSNVHNSTSGTLVATILSAVFLVLGAMGVFSELQSALNHIWHVQTRPGRTLINFLKDRLLTFIMVVLIGVLVLASLLAVTALQAMARLMAPTALPGGPALWILCNEGLSVLILCLLFMMLFKVLPDVIIRWKEVWIGAVVTALLFTLGKYLLGLYLSWAGFASAYGAFGSVVVVLVWVYYSSLIVLLGAEFTHAYARQTGSPCLPAANAECVETPHAA